jgi:hypothetical protein
MIRLCPICQVEMKRSSTSDMYGCPERRIFSIPEINQEFAYWDAGMVFNADDSNLWQMYEILPYQIIIHNKHQLHGTKTTITKLIIYPPDMWNFKTIFTVDAALELPWADREQVIEKIKLYSTFS